MSALLVLLLSAAIVASTAMPASAEPKGANGETCTSSKTGVKRTIQGKAYVCDSCTYSKCDTIGGSISNCRLVTHYSNCSEASAARPAPRPLGVANPNVLTSPSRPPPSPIRNPALSKRPSKPAELR